MRNSNTDIIRKGEGSGGAGWGVGGGLSANTVFKVPLAKTGREIVAAARPEWFCVTMGRDVSHLPL